MVKNIIKKILMMVDCKGILLESKNEAPGRKRMGYLKDHNRRFPHFPPLRESARYKTL
jgi:hypothetical protein